MTQAAQTLGYRPITDYAGALPATVTRLIQAVAGREWPEVFPTYLRNSGGPDAFNYGAEDAWLQRVP